jgi:hypothetical protein
MLPPSSAFPKHIINLLMGNLIYTGITQDKRLLVLIHYNLQPRGKFTANLKETGVDEQSVLFHLRILRNSFTASTSLV